MDNNFSPTSKKWRKYGRRLKKKRLCILKHFLPFLDNLRVSILQEKYTSKHVYPSIRVSPNSFHNLERISRGLAEPKYEYFPTKFLVEILVVNWLYDNQETDEYQETEIEKCHVFCLMSCG